MSKEFVQGPPSEVSHFRQSPQDGSRQSQNGGCSKIEKSQKNNKKELKGDNSRKSSWNDDLRTSLEVSDMETRILGCEILLNRIKTNTMSLSKERKNPEEEKPKVTKKENNVKNVQSKVKQASKHVMTNKLPNRDEEKLNSKFNTSEVNLAIMNPGGLRGKSGSINNAVNNYDIRICIVSETHCVGKEVPEINNQMKAFYNNRSDKSNKGGICIFIENTMAEETVVIGKSSPPKNDESNIEWIAVKINAFKRPVVIIGTYGCQSSKNSTEESLRKWEEVTLEPKSSNLDALWRKYYFCTEW